MRSLLRKLILWALNGYLPAALPAPVHDAAGIDKIAAEIKQA